MINAGRKGPPQSDLSVLNGQSPHHPQILPVAGLLGKVITYLYQSRTQGVNVGSQGRPGTDSPTSGPQVYSFAFVGVEPGEKGRGGWCLMSWATDAG